MSTKSIAEVIRELEKRAPSGTAEDWDNVGLLVGDSEWKTPGTVVSIDLTSEAIETAIKKKFKLIVNHHPCIFPRNRGLSRVVAGARGGTSELVFEALRNGIAVAAYHTNFDRCALEVVQAVSKGLGLLPMGRLVDKPAGSLLKLVSFVPETHVDSVRSALCEAGAGQIGAYDFCTFGARGEGTFRGGDQTHPFLGKAGQLERVEEARLETILPRGMEKAVLSALFKAHPYEEVAYDLYQVQQAPSAPGLVKGLGYGFWGDFPTPKPFSEVAKDVKRLFDIDGFLLTKRASSGHIKRVGFAAGKGSSFLEAASSVNCDLFITGEADYHEALEGPRRGLTVIELGHRESERFFLSTIEGWLSSPGPLGLKVTSLNSPTQKIV